MNVRSLCLVLLVSTACVLVACQQPEPESHREGLYVVQDMRFEEPAYAIPKQEVPKQEVPKPQDNDIDVTVDDMVFSIPDPPPLVEAEPKAKQVPIPDPAPDEPSTAFSADTNETALSPTELALKFRSQREQTNGLRFQPAVGTWANTYVPGDRTTAVLASQLLNNDRGDLPANAQLHTAVRPAVEPFDAPLFAALDVNLAADRRVIDGPSRLLVRVGLQGTPRSSSRRPALHLAVVLDLEEPSTAEAREIMQALVEAFADSRDIGDRFLLMASGQSGVILPPEQFRRGPLRLMLPALLENRQASGGVSLDGVSLKGTLHEAQTILAEDEESLLGSRQIVLITDRGLAAADLDGMAHASAVAGIPWSVVGLPNAKPEELGRIAIAGQGNRRLLSRPQEAAALVCRELAASGRLVARALRLDIRLANGVQLVEVVGSEKLGSQARARVYEAEAALDRTLQRELGIQADRGDEEDGIRIFIPTFFAGDAHAVLLDVVAPGPGAIADVTIRYKDLVRLRNGTVRGHLALTRGTREMNDTLAGPLERQVTRSYLAHRLAESLDRAAQRLRHANVDGAVLELLAYRDLVTGLAALQPELFQTGGWHQDSRMLNEYVELLGSTAANGRERSYLQSSLRYAAMLRRGPYRGDVPTWNVRGSGREG